MNTKPDIEALERMLTRLKLTAIRDGLDRLLDEAARSDFTLRESLAFLCEAEVARKDERRIQMASSIAKFPFVRTLEGFDFDSQPSLDPKQIRELASARWVGNGDALLLLGPPGVGKTHCDNGSSMARERQRCQAAPYRNEMTPRLIGVSCERRCSCSGYVSRPKGCRPDHRRLA